MCSMSHAPLPDKDARGRFQAGNQAGRGNTSAGRHQTLVNQILAKTGGDLSSLVNVLISIAHGEKQDKSTPSIKERLQAIEALMDRAIGKPSVQVNHSSADDIARDLMASRLMLRLLDAQSDMPPMIDVEPTSTIQSLANYQ